MTVNKRVKYLSRDSAFGILTRPALELTLSEHPRSKIVRIYVLDLNDIHKLNTSLGYDKVNEKITSILKSISNSYKGLILGRVFSGDEIAIINAAGRHLPISRITPFFQKQGITFKCVYAESYFGRSAKFYHKMFNKLSNQLRDRNFYQVI